MAERRPGVAVDSRGGPVVDPTQNVRELVLAESKYQDYAREAESRRQDDLREAETRRVNDLAAARSDYDTRLEAVKSDSGKHIADILASQADKSALLLSGQVDKLTTATTDRLAVVERNQYTSSGSASIRDPATDRVLVEIAATLASLKSGGDKTEGRGQGVALLAVVAAQVLTMIISIAAVAVSLRH